MEKHIYRGEEELPIFFEEHKTEKQLAKIQIGKNKTMHKKTSLIVLSKKTQFDKTLPKKKTKNIIIKYAA